MKSQRLASALIEQRFATLNARDFSALYATYHPAAPFLTQFPTLDAYLAFADQMLSDIQLNQTHIGESRETAEGVEIISGLSYQLAGDEQSIFELALLLPTSGGWRYHSAQKLTAEDYSGTFADLDFVRFDQQVTKIRF